MHMCHCIGTRLKIQSKQGQRQWMVTWIKCGEGSGTWDSALSALLTMDGFIKTRYTFIYNYPFYRYYYCISALGTRLLVDTLTCGPPNLGASRGKVVVSLTSYQLVYTSNTQLALQWIKCKYKTFTAFNLPRAFNLYRCIQTWLWTLSFLNPSMLPQHILICWQCEALRRARSTSWMLLITCARYTRFR